jgi:hypothetical protein
MLEDMRSLEMALQLFYAVYSKDKENDEMALGFSGLAGSEWAF